MRFFRTPIGAGSFALALYAAAVHAAAGAPAAPDDSAALARSLSAAEQRLGPADPNLLPILAPLAQLRFENADLAGATALRRRSLKIAIAAYGGSSLAAGQAMAALAHLYVERRRYLDAEPLIIAAADVLSARLGEGDPALAPVLADRARISLAQGDRSAARKWAEAAVAIDRRSGGEPSADRLRALGAVLAADERFEDAEPVLRRALALDRAQGDPLATARSLAGLANLYLRQKRFLEALPLIEEATAIDQNRLGAAHPTIAEDLHDLGIVYLATDRAADAATAFRAAIGVLDRGAGRGTPTLAYVELDLARAEHALGHDDKAQSLFSAARHILNAAEEEERVRQRRA